MEDSSIINQIRKIQKATKTGRLKVAGKEQAIQIYFQDGSINAISSNSEGDRLGQHLVRQGFINSRELHKLLKRAAQSGTALGETALQYKVLNVQELCQLIQWQAFQLFKRCVENGLQIRSFESSSNRFSFPIHVQLGWLLVEWARDRDGFYEDDFDETIALKKGKELSSVPWSPEEIAVLSQLNIPRTLEELTMRSGISAEQVKKTVKVLEQLDFIEIVKVAPNQAPGTEAQQSLPWESLIPVVENPLYSDKLEILKNESSFISEQFKSLKVRLREPRGDQPVQVINISSAGVDDGKSLVSTNLALCLSKDPGRKVALLDCDFRVPSVQKYLGISLAPGIIGYLRDARLQPYCCMRRIGNLYIMTSGGVAENPVELLSLKRMRELIDRLRTEFEIIILDSPPVQPIPDGRILSNLADGVVMVIRRGKTPYSSVQQALKCINPRKMMGVVFNDVKPLMFHTYYNYKYYHYGQQTYYDSCKKGELGHRYLGKSKE